VPVLLAISEASWAAIGVGVTVAVAVIGWLGGWFRRRRREKPRITFDPLYFFGSDQPKRPNYRQAVAFRIRNIGATALNVSVALADPAQGPNYAEVVSRPALVRDEYMTDLMGLRGEERDDDLTDEEARSFFDRALLVVICSDQHGRSYLFFPGGPPEGVKFSPDDKEVPWSSQDEMLHYLSGFPSRGAPPTSQGRGRF
jgi:hypothetical protein